MKLLYGTIGWDCECDESHFELSIKHLKRTENGVELIGCNNCNTLFIIKGAIVIEQLNIKLGD